MVYVDNAVFIVQLKDRRDEYLIRSLRADGYKTQVMDETIDNLTGRPVYLFSMTTQVASSDIVRLSEDAIVFLNTLNPELYDYAQKSNTMFVEYLDDESFLMKNAQLTAEGALSHILTCTPKSIRDTSVLIMGYGRVGKACSLLFYDNHINLAVVNRSELRLAEALVITDKIYTLSEAPYYFDDFDIIINTIPACVLTIDNLKMMREDTVIIDLASSPGGVDSSVAKSLGIEVVQALGLPGKIAPATAAENIKSFIIKDAGFKFKK
ncbi:MAG: hypothetical protein LBE09_04845 [Christensenellaceae bacterium]|jgi:dipicolinate synthase subunit A|nr:hypothetical protein [Christensenellaceae bacterium]